GATARTLFVQRAESPWDRRPGGSLGTQFGQILSQVDQLAGDSGFNGINLLDSNNSPHLTVTLNEPGTSSVTVTAVDFSSNGLAINNAQNSWGGAADITAASTDLT